MEAPDLLAVGGVDCGDAGVRGGDVHDAADDQRGDFAGAEAGTELELCAGGSGSLRRFIANRAALATAFHDGWTAHGGGFKAGGTHVIGPRYFELGDVLRADLGEGGEAHATGIVTVGLPLFSWVERDAVRGDGGGVQGGGLGQRGRVQNGCGGTGGAGCSG